MAGWIFRITIFIHCQTKHTTRLSQGSLYLTNTLLSKLLHMYYLLYIVEIGFYTNMTLSVFGHNSTCVGNSRLYICYTINNNRSDYSKGMFLLKDL